VHGDGGHPASGEITVVGTEATNQVRFEPVVAGRFLRSTSGVLTQANPANPAITDLNAHLVYTDTVRSCRSPNPSGKSPSAIRAASSGTLPARASYVTGMGSDKRDRHRCGWQPRGAQSHDFSRRGSHRAL